MKHQKTNTLKKALFLIGSFLLFQNILWSQGHLEVTVQDGTVTTTCDDIFGAPDPRFSVNIQGDPFVTYPATAICFTDYPNMQYEAFYNCPSDVPATINVCFRVFEDDGAFCNLNEACMVEICQDFAVPAPGASIDHTVQVIDGLASDGELNFTIALDEGFIGGLNDLVCDAFELGSVPFLGAIGDPLLSNYNNFCATNIGDPNPSAEGGVFGNDQGVWFTFTTDANPSAYNYINAFSDPEGLGDDIGIQLALYESNDGTCNDIALVYSDHDDNSLDQTLVTPCLEPNTRYYILVDAAFLPGTGIGLEGYFGIQVAGAGIIETQDFRCDAENLGLIPEGGSVATPLNQTNYCGTNLGDPNPSTYVLQRGVWFTFQAPETGHVIIDLVSDELPPLGLDPIDLQAAVYSSGNNSCTGQMIELTSQFTAGDYDETVELQCLVPGDNYWISIDGSGSNTVGIFSIEISDGGPVGPQSITVLDEIICEGGSLQVGDSLYTQSGTIEELILADNGCDSLIMGTVTILDPIMTTVDTMICSGESVSVGNSVYFDSGNYTDVLTSYQSCDSTVFTNVTVLESVEAVAFQVAEASDQTASDGSATVTVTGGMGPYTYLWSNSATTQTIDNLSPGLYCVTVTAANGCEDVTCISVLYPGAISVDIQNDEVTCNGYTDGVLTITVSDGMPAYDYEWGLDFGPAQGSGTINNAGESAMITDLSPGANYTITITDADGLIIVTFGEITEPAPIINNLDTVLCFGETLMVGSTIYTASGPILENLISPDGCDSLVTGTLTVLDEIATTLDLTECFGETVTIGTQDYTSTGPINEILTAANGCDSTVTGFLTILPEIITPLNPTICFGETFEVGNSIYTTSGIYTDTIEAANGCDSTINTTLTIVDELTLAVNLVTEASGLGNPDGIGEAVPTGGAGNFTYEWSHGPNGNITSDLVGGQTYCVTVTDDIGCTAENCVIALFPVDIQSLFENDTLDCPGNTNGAITFSAFNGQIPYNYTWQNASNSLNGMGTISTEGGMAMIPNLPAGTYTLEISDQWGAGIFVVEVVEPSPMIIDLDNQTDASCFGECDGTLSVAIIGGESPYTYQWSAPAGNTPSLDNLCAGIYDLTVTDTNGCTATWTNSIAQPDEFIVEVLELNPVSCNGGADGTAIVQTNGTPTSILWNNGEITAEIGDLALGTYSVTVTNSDNCTGEASLEITEPLSAIISTITIDQAITCNGETDAAISIAATGGTGFTFAWSNGIVSDDLENLGPGTYAVTITDDNGCEAFDEITLTEPSPINATFTSIEVNCPDGENSGQILVDNVTGGIGDYIYSSNGVTYSTLAAFNNLVADTYEIYIQDVNGCIESFPVTVDSPGEISVDLGGDFTLSLGESVTLDAMTNSSDPVFEWSIDTLNCTDCSSVEINPIDPAMYAVTVTDTLTGCSATDQIVVTIKKDRDVFIPNIFSPNFDGTNDVFMVYSGPSVAMINNFVVYNRWGGIVFEASNVLPGEEVGWDGAIKGKDAPDGVYVYLVDIEFVDGFQRLYRGDVTVVR